MRRVRDRRGLEIRIRGTVQGVGFRPWVYRVARAAGVTGRVRNGPSGVTIEAFGTEGELERFIAELEADPPAAARIVELTTRPIESEPVEGFTIVPSDQTGKRALSIPPDLATCPKCEAEVLDPDDRRFRYAFTNCTECGPRFTISTDVPYDRVSTTMHVFPMCPDCLREYKDVEDRRFHAQPNACPVCGPHLTLLDVNGDPVEGDPIENTAEWIASGRIVAVKGLGGFHLACDACRQDVVQRLRVRKHRDEKPFAVMVRDLDAARALAWIDDDEADLLTAPERPIVLLERKPDVPVAASVAPDTPLLGLFLPYTPLHHLLLAAVGRPLIMTSANVANEPICKDNDEAKQRLFGIADGFLVHNREIATRCDDSVARVIAARPTVMRRSRGFVPRAVRLTEAVDRPVLACGAHLKNTFCVAVDDQAYFGPHIGDLETLAALEFYEQAIERMQTILRVEPEVIAYDLHPGYLSTQYAQRRSESQKLGVQHHHAHVVSAMAEHGLEGPVIGVAYDGTGFGTDGTSWGGEILWVHRGRFERKATFRPIALAGGDVAMHEIWRIALAVLRDAFDGNVPDVDVLRLVPTEPQRVVRQMLEKDLNTPRARGVGRYFDAIGALVLGRPLSSYEGQVAIALNMVADPGDVGAYPYEVRRDIDPHEIDLRPLVRAVIRDLQRGQSAGRISARFHNTIVAATTDVVAALEPAPVVLTGGVFQNARLAEHLVQALPAVDRTAYLHGEVPPNDGGIALGQALVANAVLSGGE